MKKIQIFSLTIAVALTLQSSHALDFGVKNDLWDIAQGTTITANSPFDAAFGSPHPYDGRDIFGGYFGDYLPERGDVVFDDNQAAGFVHFVEWRTASPVTIGSFKLHAAADGNPTFQREIARFRLLAKSSGSTGFDLTLFDVTLDRPYTYLDAATYLLIQATISPVTAQQFRAEFFDVGGTPFGGPRVIELDGFAPVPEPTVMALLMSGAVVIWRFRRQTR
jgi:hypothetical protein